MVEVWTTFSGRRRKKERERERERRKERRRKKKRRTAVKMISGFTEE